jgi:hypothetical protein
MNTNETKKDYIEGFEGLEGSQLVILAKLILQLDDIQAPLKWLQTGYNQKSGAIWLTSEYFDTSFSIFIEDYNHNVKDFDTKNIKYCVYFDFDKVCGEYIVDTYDLEDITGKANLQYEDISKYFQSVLDRLENSTEDLEGLTDKEQMFITQF